LLQNAVTLAVAAGGGIVPQNLHFATADQFAALAGDGLITEKSGGIYKLKKSKSSSVHIS
jgi:hypothetical protein